MTHKVISMTTEEKNKLDEVRVVLQTRLGIKLSYSKTISYLMNEWRKYEAAQGGNIKREPSQPDMFEFTEAVESEIAIQRDDDQPSDYPAYPLPSE